MREFTEDDRIALTRSGGSQPPHRRWVPSGRVDWVYSQAMWIMLGVALIALVLWITGAYPAGARGPQKFLP